MLEDIDLTAIQDENVRQLVLRLLNLIESLAADLREAQAENQRLRDEINRLKGEQDRPKVKANTPKPTSDHSSEPERRQRLPRSKKAALRIDREQVLAVEPARLPADAEFKGYEDVVVQDLIFRSDNVCFHKQKYYAASTGQTYLAELPPGHAGQFGPGIKVLAVTLYFGGQMSEPKIQELFAYAGVQISAGGLSNLLIKDQARFHQEQTAVYEAGLRSSPWQHTDDTVTRVNGQNQHCHVVCNPVHTAYQTKPTKERLAVLDVLRNGRARRFRLNQEALSYFPAATRRSSCSRRCAFSNTAGGCSIVPDPRLVGGAGGLYTRPGARASSNYVVVKVRSKGMIVTDQAMRQQVSHPSGGVS
ncbi:MAG: transposase [Chloroflexi bacterium]|nr:transposase [Chloroflexota bacterium]MBU1751165.1 transposase [Chloroflexota bacterium]MBU1879508.1 transposase [Chloroflexota bacterium]